MNKPHLQLTSSHTIGKDNHCSYFQSLENRLLVQSDQLTNFIGKSVIHQPDAKALRLNLSAAKLSDPTQHPLIRPSSKHETNRTRNSKIQRAKQYLQILKNPLFIKEPGHRPSRQSTKEKYEQLRTVVYNIYSSVKEEESKQKIDTLQHGKGVGIQQGKGVGIQQGKGVGIQQEKGVGIQQEKTSALQQGKSLNLQQGKETAHDQQGIEKEDTKRNSRLAHEGQSLKDTVSTNSCKSMHFSSQQLLPLGQTRVKLDDLDPIKLLGHGNLGEVCLVRHRKTGMLCALKEIPKARLSLESKELTQRIREIKIQSFLDHPNIVQLYSVFVQETNLYLLIELCSGGNLYQQLKAEGSFPEDRIRSVIKQVSHAVEYMHDNDILHRDIKPENILFHENIAKICDFGWAVHSPLLRDTRCGTPLYSPPEIVQKQHYDNKIDVWNLGILTYELAYGRVPFQIRTEEEVIKVVEEDIYFPRSQPASPEIKDFILRCLSKNPRDRLPVSKLIDHEFLNPRSLQLGSP